MTHPTTEAPEIVSISPAPAGWWVVFAASQSEDKEPRYSREPVAAWALVRFGQHGGQDIRPLTDNDDCTLNVPEDGRWLWNEASGSRCSCGNVNPPGYSRDDPWWCRVCAGLIEPG